MRYLKKIFNNHDYILDQYKLDLDLILKQKEKYIKNFGLEFNDNHNELIKYELDNFKKIFNLINSKDLKIEKKELQNTIKNHKIELLWFFLFICQYLNTHDNVKWKYIPYNQQIIAILAIIEWNIIEMKTWEWKSLVSFLGGIIMSLYWKQTFIVSVNDYLIDRDYNEFKYFSDFLWIKVWLNKESLHKNEKIEIYKSNIIYTTHQELVFDYLRDNLNITDEFLIKDYYNVILDEIDWILIDEWSKPVMMAIKSGNNEINYDKYRSLSYSLEKDIDYKLFNDLNIIRLTDEGLKKLEKLLNVNNLFLSETFHYINWIENYLTVENYYINNKNYIIENNTLIMLDNNGRKQLNRTFPNWLQQSIEAKEWLHISNDNKTLSSITYQNFFKKFMIISWMSWTIKTEENELNNIYWIHNIISIPRIKENQLNYNIDLFFKSNTWKDNYMLSLIKDINKSWQPILIWWISNNKAIHISNLLKAEWLIHNLLTANNDLEESEILKKAWNKWNITIITNMSWRWTDIVINYETNKLGWLYIIWYERNLFRRHDNQLSGRAWRQWNKWTIQFLISPQDDIFLDNPKLDDVLNSWLFVNIQDNEPISSNIILNKIVEWIQKNKEKEYYEIRKNIISYDNIVNIHRDIIYNIRKNIIQLNDKEFIDLFMLKIMDNIPNKIANNIEFSNYDNNIEHNLYFNIKNKEFVEIVDINNYKNEIKNYLLENNNKEFIDLMKLIYLNAIDLNWNNHLSEIDKLKLELTFFSNLQRDPLQEYIVRCHELFWILNKNIIYKIFQDLWEVYNNYNKIDIIELRTIIFNNYTNNKILLKWLNRKELNYIWKDIKENWFMDFSINEIYRTLSKSELTFIWNNIKSNWFITNKKISRV